MKRSNNFERNRKELADTVKAVGGVFNFNRTRKPMKSYDFRQFPLPASTNRRFLGTSPCVRPRLGSPQA